LVVTGQELTCTGVPISAVCQAIYSSTVYSQPCDTSSPLSGYTTLTRTQNPHTFTCSTYAHTHNTHMHTNTTHTRTRTHTLLHSSFSVATLFVILLLLWFILMPSHYTLPSCTYLPQIPYYYLCWYLVTIPCLHVHIYLKYLIIIYADT
jgi:hypothetical protein